MHDLKHITPRHRRYRYISLFYRYFITNIDFPLVSRVGTASHKQGASSSRLIVECTCDVKWLDPEGVAGEQQPLLFLIPQGKGEHTAQSCEHLPSVKRIKLEQFLHIRARVKAHAEDREFRTQLAVVVDFAVENDAVAGLSVDHRLRPSLREVDNSKATVGKADAKVMC